MKKLSEQDRVLKEFLDNNFDFYELRKAGLFPKDWKKTDIHKQAQKICELFNYKTVFEYNAHPIYAHISYADGHRPMHVDEQGKLKAAPFVEKFGGWAEE